MATDEELNFAKELILFYKEFTAGNAKAINLLADLQANHPKLYTRLREVNNNPESIGDVAIGLPTEVKDAIILILLKASKIGRNSQRLFDMTPEEQRQFAKELIEYAEFVQKKAEEIEKFKNKAKTGSFYDVNE